MQRQDVDSPIPHDEIVSDSPVEGHRAGARQRQAQPFDIVTLRQRPTSPAGLKARVSLSTLTTICCRFSGFAMMMAGGLKKPVTVEANTA